MCRMRAMSWATSLPLNAATTRMRIWVVAMAHGREFRICRRLSSLDASATASGALGPRRAHEMNCSMDDSKPWGPGFDLRWSRKDVRPGTGGRIGDGIVDKSQSRTCGVDVRGGRN